VPYAFTASKLSDADSVVVTVTGNMVGIGTTDPEYEVEVQGSGIQDLQVKSETTGSTNAANLRINRGDQTNGYASLIYLTADSETWVINIPAGSDDLRFYDYGGTEGERIRIQSATGNLGIQVASPNAKLSISGTGTELGGTAMSSIIRTNAGSLGTTQGDEFAIASFGFKSGNNSALGIRAYRTSNGSDYTTTAISLGMDVDNTARVNDASLWLYSNGNIGVSGSLEDKIVDGSGNPLKVGQGSDSAYYAVYAP
jgi:hypothetical protein